MDDELGQEVDRNFEILLGRLSALLPEREGQFALLRRGEIDSFFPAEREALAAGRRRYADGIYSVQEVTRRPVDLGFFSHAIDKRIAG